MPTYFGNSSRLIDNLDQLVSYLKNINYFCSLSSLSALATDCGVEIVNNVNVSWRKTGEFVLYLLLYSVKHCTTIIPMAMDGEVERHAASKIYTKAHVWKVNKLVLGFAPCRNPSLILAPKPWQFRHKSIYFRSRSVSPGSVKC